MEKQVEKNIEEILEALWTDKEQEKDTRVGSLKSPHQSSPLLAGREMETALKIADQAGLVEVSGTRIRLTGDGEKRALDLVRRHRLAERLFYDVLDLGHEETESSACNLEHLLSAEATNSVCILLGHPTTCPHGNPIPRGECCQQRVVDSRPLVMPAAELRPGEEATVAYVGSRSRERIDRISSLGIAPGIEVRLVQRQPTFVLRLGETQLALDKEIVKDIYVRRSRTQPDESKPKKPVR